MSTTPPRPDGPMRTELRQARHRFVSTCPKRLDELAALAAHADDAAARGDLGRAAHRLVGAAGLVGMTALSAAARALEEAMRFDEAPASAASDHVTRLREAFARDEADMPEWARDDDPDGPPPLTLVLAEDDEVQRLALTRYLEGLGHDVTAVGRGDEVMAVVRRLRPAILVLDVNLPGVDGHTLCRQVKADPTLAAVGVVFLTATISSDDRLTGLLLGADDYIEKPIDLAELGLRLSTVASRRSDAARQPPRQAAGEIGYAQFVERASDLIARVPAALVLLRMPADVGHRVATWLAGELRRDDLLCRYRDDLRMLLLPGLTGRTATRHVGDIVGRLAASGLPVASGIAAVERAGARPLSALLQDADAALTASAATAPLPLPVEDAAPTVMLRRRSVVVADDDEGTRLLAVRPLMRAGLHFRTAADGREALALIDAEVPEVLVLDLAMPEVGGLEVLETLRQRQPPRPRVIVVSANRQEEDVRKALTLGADDYVVKPFNPLMLLARIRQLMH